MTTSSQQEDSIFSENIIGALVGTNSCTKLLQFRLKGKRQRSSESFLGKRWGKFEDFLSKTKNPRLRQDFGEQAHRFTPIAF